MQWRTAMIKLKRENLKKKVSLLDVKEKYITPTFSQYSAHFFILWLCSVEFGSIHCPWQGLLNVSIRLIDLNGTIEIAKKSFLPALPNKEEGHRVSTYLFTAVEIEIATRNLCLTGLLIVC